MPRRDSQPGKKRASASSVPSLKSQMTLSLGALEDEDIDPARLLQVRTIGEGECIVMPTSAVLLVWEVVVALGVGLVGFSVPVALAYIGVSALSEGALGAMLLVADLLWFLNIGIHFRTAV